MMPNSQARRSLLLKTALCTGVIIIAQVPLAQATTLPTGSTVVSGSANISTTGSVMTVDIKSTSPVITWQTFSVPTGDTVKFVSTTAAPLVVDTAQRAVLNRVIGNGATLSPSIINGLIDSTNSGHNNIQVWLVNPAGITFGMGGAYNGGSLILSTLDVPNADFSAGAAAATHFSKYTMPGGLTYDSTATKAVTLSALAGAIQSTGSILVLGQSVSVGNTVTAGDKLAVITGDAVTFAAGVGSPLSFTIGTGSSLLAADGTGVRILGSAVMSGKSITVAAVSQAAALTNVLQADSGATLTATDTNGVISLATKTLGTVTVGTADSHDSLVDNTGVAANTGLIANGTDGAISLAGAGAVTLGGNLTATAGTASITANGTTLAFAGGAIKSAGNQTYTGAVTLNANTTLTSTGGLVKFVQPIDSAGSARALSVVGNAEFDGAIGAINVLASVAVSGTSALDGGSVKTSGTQAYSSAATLGVDTALTATTVGFGATVDGAHALAITGNASFGGALGATAALTLVAVSGTTALNGGSITTSGAQTYSGAVTLGADTTLSATSGQVKFVKTVDSAGSASAMTITGNAEFDGAVGGNQALRALSVASLATINGGTVTTTGAQTYGDAVTLGADTTLTSTSGLVKFAQTVDSDATARLLTIAGNTEFDGAVGQSGALGALSVASLATINGGTVTTTGAQTYGDAVTLGADTTLTSTSGLVKFVQTVDSDSSAHALNVAGNAEFDGAVGATSALASVSVSGTSVLNAGTISTQATQRYSGAVTLDTITTLFTGGYVGSVAFGATVDGAASLFIFGNASFAGAVGGTTALSSVTVSGTSALNGGSVKTSGDQIYSDIVTLGADTTLTSTGGGLMQFIGAINSDATARALSVVGRAEFDANVGGTKALASVAVTAPTRLSAGLITTTGAQTYSGAVTLGADTKLTSSGGLVKFVQTVDSDASTRLLKIIGNAEFDSAVGGTTALTSLLVSGTSAINGGTVTTTGAQTYGDAVTLGADTILTSTAGLVKFTQKINSDSLAHALNVVGNAEFDGAVGLDNVLASVSVSGTSVLNAGSIITRATQTYSGAVTLLDVFTSLDAGTGAFVGTVAFGATVDGAASLYIQGNASFAGAVGSTTALSSLGVTGTSALKGGSVKTAADQTYTDAATLGADTTLTSATGLVRFFGLLDSDATARALTVVGSAEFDANVGRTMALASVAVTGPTGLSAGLITTTGAQTYSGAVTLGADTRLTSSGGLVKFVQTVDSDANTRLLEINGNAEFDSAVGGSIALTSLFVTGTSAINGGAATTTGAQTYGDAVTLGANTKLTSTGGLVQFTQTLDSDATARALTVVGRAEFDSTVGGANPLASVAVTGTSALTGGSVKTVAAQTYNDAVTLGADTTLTSTGGGLVQFIGAINSDATARALTVVGRAEFDSTVGGTNALASVAVTGTSALNGGSVKTVAAQTYNDAVTLGADTTLTSTGGGLVQFIGVINSDATPRALTVVGKAEFDDQLGIANALASVAVSGTSVLNAGSISTTGAQTYSGAVTLDKFTQLLGPTVAFGATVDGAQSLFISGNASFAGAVGGTTALSSVTVNGTSALNGGSVKTVAAQAYNDAVTLGADTTLTSTGGLVQFTQTLDSDATARALTVVGRAEFDTIVGGTRALASVAVTGATRLNAGSITTTGAQTYSGAVTLGVDTKLTTSGGLVKFVQIVDSDFGTRALAIDGNAEFDSAVGGSAALRSLLVTGTSAINGGAVMTTGVQTYGDAVTLGADTTLTSTGGLVIFTQTLDSDATARALTVAGRAEFDSAVGGTNTLASVAVTGTSALNGGFIFTTGTQTYNGAVTLGADTKLSATGGLVKFVQTVDSDATARALGIVGNAEFDGTVGGTHPLAQLTINAPATITATGNISALGTIELNAATSLSVAGLHATGATSDIVINQGGGTVGSVTLTGAISAGRNYLLTATSVALGNGIQVAPGRVDITATTGDITGGTASLASQGGSVVLDAASGTITLGTGSALTATTGNVGIRYAVGSTVGLGDVTAMSFGEVDAGHTIFSGTFATAINNLTTGAVTTTANPINIKIAGALTMGAANSIGSVTLEGASVALGTALSTSTASSYTVTADTGTITLAGKVNSGTGMQTYTGAVTLGADTALTGNTIGFSSTLNGGHGLTITGNGNFTGVVGGVTPLTSLAVSGAGAINGGSVKTSGNQTYSGVATLGADTTLTSTSGLVKFVQTLDSDTTARALSVVGNAEFDAAVGATNALASVGVSGASALNGGAVKTSGAQTYSGAATLGTDAALISSSGLVKFVQTLDSDATARALSVVGNAEFDNMLGATNALASVGVSGTSALNGGAITTGGAQTYSGVATLGANTALTSSSGLVRFGAALDGAHTLLVAGNGAFDGAVGGSTALTSLAVSKASAINGGTITTTGGQTYTGAVTLAGVSPTVLTTGAGVTFGATLGGVNALTILGNAEFDGAVGGITALSSLAVSKTSLIKGGAVTTTGGQTYTGAVTLARLSPTVLTAGTIATFGATLDGANALTIAGNADFEGAVGGTTALTSLAVSKTSLIKGGAVTTIGAQTYTGAVTLAGISPTILKSGTAVTFGATLDGANALLIAGNAEFDGAVGATRVLTSLAVSKTSAINGGTITTTGAQTYTGAVTLGRVSPTILTTGTGITFAATLDGANALIIAGNADFEGAVGGTTALRSLAVSKTSLIDSGKVTTTGGQTYTGAVTLAGITPTVLKTGTTTTFASTLDGVNALTIAGNAVFDGAVGGKTALASLAVSKTSAINGGAVTTTGGQTYTGAATLGGANPTTLKTGTAVNFGGTLDGANALTIMGNAAFGGTVGGATALTRLIITAPGTIAAAADVNVTGPTTLNAASVAVTGAANSGGALAIVTSGSTQLGSGNGGSTVNITAGALTVTGAVKSGAAMVINTGTGAVQLGSLNSGAATTVAGGAITVSGDLASTGLLTMNAGTGALTITGTTTQGADSVLTAATSANLGIVNAGANAVTLTAADATLGGLITAGNITIIDNGAAGNTLYLGDAGTRASGFHLDQGEISNLAAANVVLDAGTGVTHQDVGIGNLSLNNAALRMLGVYGLGRIDVSGNLVTGSGSGLTALQLGGTGTVSNTNLATVLRIAAATDGTGGRIAIGGGALDLRAASIGVGLDTGFLKVLGVAPGSIASQTATFMVSNASSALYDAQVGGAAYTAAGQSLIVAGGMTVHYTNFALFQNTGGPGTNLGVALGSTAKPGTPALSLTGPNPPDGGPFAIFGQINGVSNIPAAVLGPTTIVINAVNRTTARINGCLIGSGAGCLTSAALSTSLADIDPARTTIILANANFELPFDPLVATNNDSLFGDVGTFGLDIAEPPVDCVPGAKDNCGTHKEGKSQ